MAPVTLGVVKSGRVRSLFVVAGLSCLALAWGDPAIARRRAAAPAKPAPVADSQASPAQSAPAQAEPAQPAPIHAEPAQPAPTDPYARSAADDGGKPGTANSGAGSPSAIPGEPATTSSGEPGVGATAAQDPHQPAGPDTPSPSASVSPDDSAAAAKSPSSSAVAAIAPLATGSLDGSPFTAPPPPGVPPSPQDPRAAKAYAVFASYCASCHQRTASAPASAPAAGIGNVLDLAALARNPSLVRPGNPDGSPLYQTLYARHAPGVPLDASQGSPTVGEVEAVRDWIESLPRREQGCPDRRRIDAAELDAIMRRWLEVAGAEVARATRFVSLAHLHNACASDAELAANRQAVQKLLNSLSWSPEPVHIETVGDELVLLAFRLSDLGWVPAHWERLAKAEPAGGAVPIPEALKSVSGSQHPVIRGDWLASVAGRAPMYYELLGLPDKQADLAKLLGIDLAASTHGAQAMRGGLRSSAETHAPRLMARFGTAGKHGLWLAHDWPPATRPDDVVAHPLAPAVASPGKPLAPPSGSRALLTLPNGFPAFALYDADGAVRSQVGGVAAGRACMGCHVSGPRGFVDEVRPTLSSGASGLPHDIKEAALAAYPPAAGLARQLDDDAYVTRRALIQAGIDPDLTLNGLEIVDALAETYERGVDLQRLVAESGLERAEVLRRLDGLQGDLRHLAQRVRLSPVPRSDAELLLAALQGATGSGMASAASAGVAASWPAQPASGEPRARRIDLALWADRVAYAPGDLVQLSAQTSRDCYLTLIDVDTAGKATVLFPNEFEPDNLLKAGAPLHVPGDKAPYQLRLKDKGRETTVAVCSTARRMPLGIEADYERQRFTSLGLWRNFLNDAQPLEAEYRANPEKARANAAERARAAALALAKGRSAADDAAAAARAVPEPASPGPEAETRTAIQVRVE